MKGWLPQAVSLSLPPGNGLIHTDPEGKPRWTVHGLNARLEYGCVCGGDNPEKPYDRSAIDLHEGGGYSATIDGECRK